MLSFCDFIQVYVFATNHHLKGDNIGIFVIFSCKNIHPLYPH